MEFTHLYGYLGLGGWNEVAVRARLQPTSQRAVRAGRIKILQHTIWCIIHVVSLCVPFTFLTCASRGGS